MSNIKPADRVSAVQEYYFSTKLKQVAEMNAEGKDIISLAIGSPDMPPSQQTIETLCEIAKRPDAHGYQPTMGTPELRNAMAEFYKRWYAVTLNPKTEIQPLIGSKEGILHVTLAFVNPPHGEQRMAARLRRSRENGPLKGKAYVDKLSQHAHRRRSTYGDIRKTGGFCKET